MRFIFQGVCWMDMLNNLPQTAQKKNHLPSHHKNLQLLMEKYILGFFPKMC